jgi:hypothetical protein
MEIHGSALDDGLEEGSLDQLLSTTRARTASPISQPPSAKATSTTTRPEMTGDLNHHIRAESELDHRRSLDRGERRETRLVLSATIPGSTPNIPAAHNEEDGHVTAAARSTPTQRSEKRLCSRFVRPRAALRAVLSVRHLLDPRGHSWRPGFEEASSRAPEHRAGLYGYRARRAVLPHGPRDGGGRTLDRRFPAGARVPTRLVRSGDLPQHPRSTRHVRSPDRSSARQSDQLKERPDRVLAACRVDRWARHTRSTPCAAWSPVHSPYDEG